MDINGTLVNLELYTENDKWYIYINHDGSSGCTYKINNIDDIGQHIVNYVKGLTV